MFNDLGLVNPRPQVKANVAQNGPNFQNFDQDLTKSAKEISNRHILGTNGNFKKHLEFLKFCKKSRIFQIFKKDFKILEDFKPVLEFLKS